ncbi:MAG: nitronate monooxygenase [Acidobacteria bacterium]|nr:nitronate monooxygenase [Acidobacteriota bacterium]
MTQRPHPIIIQGGMGVGISDWRLAQAVSRTGQLGVVSGTALDVLLARRLQMGDPGGHIRRALARLPLPGLANRILSRYFIEGGKSPDQPFRPMPLHAQHEPAELIDLCIAGNFVEVTLAREGHAHAVGMNYLEKIQTPHLPSIYGALLAGVDYILMGAGIPAKIPGAIDRLVNHEPATYPLHVVGAQPDDDTLMRFDPASVLEGTKPTLARPVFLPIVSSHVLAATLLKKSNGVVDGFIVEGHTAGGHNAPPRGKLQLNEAGEPVYGERDAVDLEKMRALGVPFWLAGGFGTPAALRDALREGAQGIQVGTAFAFADESGLHASYKQALRERALRGTATVFTDPLASPTSFPLKVADLPGTLSDPAVYDARVRVCDLGYLREAYRDANGSVAFRCAAEPVSTYLAKGGHAEDVAGRKCICNALVATMGLPQVRGRAVEPAIITSGDAINDIAMFMEAGRTDYTAADVVRLLIGGATANAVA